MISRSRLASLRLLCVALGILGLLAGPAHGWAQTATSADPGDYGSVYLRLGHWIYDYVDLLVARGALDELSPFVQPYRRIDVAAAVLAAESNARLSPQERGWLDAIKSELYREVELLERGRPQGIDFGAEAGVGFEGLSHTHRDLLRPAGDEKLFATLDLELRGEAPAVAGVLYLRWDNHYLNDPQFPDGRAVERRQCDPIIQECAYRVEEAYVEVQVPYVRLSFGRMYRNWGLPGRDGMLLAPYAYSYDHIGYRFGTERIALTGLFAPFNDFPGDTARYFSSHRFDWRLRENLQISVGESVIWGGPGRRIDFNLVNPVGVWEISGSSEGFERNALGMAELWWRPWRKLVTYGAFMVDNTSVGDEEQGKQSGFNQWAAALGAQLPSLAPNLALRGDLTVVNSLAYRSRVDFWEYYALDGIGLAQDKVDMILVSLQGDWYPRSGLVVSPTLDLMWKGEDDITDEFPEDAFTRPDKLLIGVIEKTIRPAVAGRWFTPRGTLPWQSVVLELEWDLGLNIVKNDDHIVSDWDVEAVGRVQADLRVRF